MTMSRLKSSDQAASDQTEFTETLRNDNRSTADRTTNNTATDTTNNAANQQGEELI